MFSKKLRWGKILPVMMAASMLMQNCYVVSAEDTEVQAEVQALKSLTSADLETGGMSAATARLKIGDWLDYGDYGIERNDVPGTTYHFYISTQDEAGNVINDQQMAYCIQSYFLTPLPGDHTEDMTDNVLSICGGTNVQKSLYYGYGGVGYNEEEFDSFLQESDPEYYANVYTYLSDSEKEELAYILTHGAASYAYFTDGTDLEEYYNLQFKIKYGDDGARQYGYFKDQELKKAGIAEDDMNLLGATYGMNPTGIALARAWYDVIAAKTDPWLEMVEEDGVYTFQGNEENEELSLRFVVPEEWNCIMTEADGSEKVMEAGSEVVLAPLENVVFSYTGEAFSTEENGLTDTATVVNGALTGAEKEVWSLVLLETNKGNEQSVSKRQQDIAAISMIDAGKTDMDFELQAEKGSISIQHMDDLGNPIIGAELGVYYDETYSEPVQMNGEPIVLKTDENGTAYMEFLFNERLKDENTAFYFKTLSIPEGYEAFDSVTWCKPNVKLQLINNSTKTSVVGTLDWNVPEGTELPDEVEVALMLNGEQIGTVTVTAEDGWKYTFDSLQAYVTDADGNKIPAEYTVEILPIDGFVTVFEDEQMILTVPTPGTAVIEGTVSLSGRDLKAGDFKFSLVQVTDASAAEELTGGYSGTAENKEDGTFAFDELTFTEEGTYYYKLTSEDGQTYTVQADVVSGGEFGELLEVTLTWMDQDGNILKDGLSAVTFEKEYHASGEWQMDTATVELENAEMEAGQFTVEMKDEQGNVLQVKSNDADGHIVFDPITYTEANIGETYVYTFAQQIPEEESQIIYDSSECEVKILIADSENSDGSLEITVESAGVFWVNAFEEAEETEMTEAQTEVQTEKQTEKQTEIQTEAETEATETEVPAEAESKMPTWSLWSIIVLIILIVLYIIRRRKNR